VEKNFDRGFPLTLKYEGGFVNDPDDPGGITIGTLSAFNRHPATIADVKALTPAKVKPIYKKRFWDKIEGDELPGGLDFALYDFAVNSGPDRAIRTLQKILGMKGVDGVLGDDTILALHGQDVAGLVNKLCDERIAFLKRLKTFPRFGRGWVARVERVRQVAATWVEEIVPEDHVLGIVDDNAGSRKAMDDDVNKPTGTHVAIAGGAGGIGAVGTAASDAAQQIAPLSQTFHTMQYIFLALTLVGIITGLWVAYSHSQKP
jgi:lysozyme family protein